MSTNWDRERGLAFLQQRLRSAQGVDDLFRQDVINALLSHKIHTDPGHMGPDDLNALIQKAWDDPTMRADWESGVFDQYGAPSFQTHLAQAFFLDPGSALFDTGIKLKQSQGIPLTAAERNAAGPTVRNVPTPFDPQHFANRTEEFGEVTGFGTEPGNDYGMPVGTALYSPFEGTIRTEDQGKGGWGKRVFVQLANGYTFAIGHLTNFSVADGQHVNPGDLLGESGGALDDPSSGISSGPHVEIQWIGPDGKFNDPYPMLQKIYGGVTFSALDEAGAAGRLTDAESDALARTRILGIDPLLNAKYPGATALWRQYFGTEPTSAQVLGVAAAGDAQQMEDLIRRMPSSIPGMNNGQRFDLRRTADAISTEIFGHTSTDGIVKELFDGGHMNKAEVLHFYNNIADTNLMDSKTYNTIYAANQPHFAAIYNEHGFDPRVAAAQYRAAGGQPATNTDAAAAADVLPLPSVDESPNAGKSYVGPAGQYTNIPLTPSPEENEARARQRVNRSGGVLVE